MFISPHLANKNGPCDQLVLLCQQRHTASITETQYDEFFS